MCAAAGLVGAVLWFLPSGSVVAHQGADHHAPANTHAAHGEKKGRSFAPGKNEQQNLWPGAVDPAADPQPTQPPAPAKPAVVDLSRDLAVFTLVPETADYTLALLLPIPNPARFNHQAVPYSVDNRPEIKQPFDRVAYCLELQTDGGEKQYAYASFDAVTNDLAKIGVPCASTGVFWQMPVKNLHVFSNVPGVATGTELTGGIEFWHTNYGPQNAAKTPEASDGAFDFGDVRSNGGDYGCLQIHNYREKQTVLAYNHWGSGAGEAGIGNQSKGNPDWTFSNNIASYQVRNLYVLVRLVK